MTQQKIVGHPKHYIIVFVYSINSTFVCGFLQNFKNCVVPLTGTLFSAFVVLSHSVYHRRIKLVGKMSWLLCKLGTVITETVKYERVSTDQRKKQCNNVFPIVCLAKLFFISIKNIYLDIEWWKLIRLYNIREKYF